MFIVNAYITVAVGLAVVTAIMLGVLRWQHAASVNRRILRMMLTFGIDEQTARDADELLDIDMETVRRRCRRCPEPGTCRRWLNGESLPGNAFCPNAPEFAAVVEAQRCRLRYDPKHRPGRRLDET